MLTSRQKEWIAHLSVTKRVSIIPFDTSAEDKFNKLKSLIQQSLGEHIPVEHRGATSLGISGQDEIDVYIPVTESEFPFLQEELRKLFGEERSAYPLIRIRFSVIMEGKHMDLFLINKFHQDWLRGIAFESCCRTNPETLERYKTLKEEMNGWSIRDFYSRKNEFINEVLEQAGYPVE